VDAKRNKSEGESRQLSRLLQGTRDKKRKKEEVGAFAEENVHHAQVSTAGGGLPLQVGAVVYLHTRKGGRRGKEKRITQEEKKLEGQVNFQQGRTWGKGKPGGKAAKPKKSSAVSREGISIISI